VHDLIKARTSVLQWVRRGKRKRREQTEEERRIITATPKQNKIWNSTNIPFIEI
jgi:hypothetical protein